MAGEGDSVNLLLAPHHDDEALFASFICLGQKPLVVVCFTGSPRHGPPEVRRAETAAAMDVLGCRWIDFTDANDDQLSMRLRALPHPDRAWAPLPEEGGHSQHNKLGEIAQKLWPGRVMFYTTYTEQGRSTCGDPVDVQPGWEALKRRALACYPSQMKRPGTRVHFERPLDEYVVTP